MTSAPVDSAAPSAAAALVRDFVHRVWDAGDPGAADPYLAPDYVDHAYQPGNRDGLKAQVALLAGAVADRRSIIEDCVAGGDRVMLRMRLQGTHAGDFRGKAPTGKRIDVRVARWFRIADGKIAEHWALLDTFGLYSQLDMLAQADGPGRR